jgi:hypothetical protein
MSSLEPRKPLAKVLASEKFKPRSIRFPDSLWARFQAAARAAGRTDLSAFFRECAVIGLDRLEFERAFEIHRRRTGIAGGIAVPAAAIPGGNTGV